MILNSEKIAIIECVIFLLILNSSICDKYDPKPGDIAPSVQVSDYGSSEMTESNLYSLKQVKPCNMTPQNIQMNDVKQSVYKTLSNRNQCHNLANQTPKKQILLRGA